MPDREDLGALRVVDGFLLGNSPRAQSTMPPISLPYGVEGFLKRAQGKARWRLFRDYINDTERFIVAQIDEGAKETPLYPYTERPMEIEIPTRPWTIPADGGRPALTFSLAARGAELIRAQEVLLRSHPQGVPRSGVFLTCQYSNPDEQRSSRQEPGPDQDPWSSAWHEQEQPGHIVGCVVMSVLYHGNPRGRLHLIRDYGMPENYYYDRSRREIVLGIGLAWISRVAVDAPYRDQRIGTALVAEARTTVASRFFPGRPRFLEVIRSVTADKAATLVTHPAKTDFIVNGGYRRVPESYPSRPARLPDATGRRQWEATPMKKLYYYAEVDRIGHQ